MCPNLAIDNQARFLSVVLGLCFPRPPHPSVFDVYGRLDQPTTTPARLITSPRCACRSCGGFTRSLALLEKHWRRCMKGKQTEGFPARSREWCGFVGSQMLSLFWRSFPAEWCSCGLKTRPLAPHAGALLILQAAKDTWGFLKYDSFSYLKTRLMHIIKYQICFVMSKYKHYIVSYLWPWAQNQS